MRLCLGLIALLALIAPTAAADPRVDDSGDPLPKGVLAAAFSPDGRILATGSADTTILLRDVCDLVRADEPAPMTPEALAAAWKDLADADAAIAYLAMNKLIRSPSQAVELLRPHLKPPQAPDAKLVDRAIDDLGDSAFEVREKAFNELKRHGVLVASTLRGALAKTSSLETKRRLNQLLELADEWRWTGDPLRILRSIEILEHIATPEARTLLESLAAGPADSRLTREAQASLNRMKK